MSLRATIGKNSADLPFSVDFGQLPHLFVSYSEETQIRHFVTTLVSSFPSGNELVNPEYALALSGRSDLPQLFSGPDMRLKYCFAPDDPFSSNTGSREKFMLSLSKEMRQRSILLQKGKESKGNGKRLFPPMIILLQDVFGIVLSRKKSIGLIFLQLLLMGKQLNMHLIAASGCSYRTLLNQLMHLNPLVRHKFKSSQGVEHPQIVTPLGAELVITAEDFIFFREANAIDYHRLYPLTGKELPEPIRNTPVIPTINGELLLCG